ncbi:unnamed protein product [[Candida] boidinii]|uniref:Unnamed protein product n=1 Tax=Candida boidinii TaxID=5477 RepID=A0ACB5U7H9_CANBO|nr:unnamed protein product [[Candida] boidinii]
MKSIAVYILEDLSKDENDIADYQPNPFYKTPWAESSKSIVNSLDLHLVDGGEDSQNIPLYPLIQKERKMDVIFAYDNSMDTREKWPSGKSLMQTYRRQFSPLGLGTAIPYIPDDNTFLNLGLNKKPTFFGCYAKNLTGLMEQVHATEMRCLVYSETDSKFQQEKI